MSSIKSNKTNNLPSFPLPLGESSIAIGRGGAPSLYLIDTTLRDGEQAPGVVFSLNEKLTIAQMLSDIGVEELEVGSPFISERDIHIIKKIVHYGFKFRSSCWSRANISDIDAAVKTGASGINISFPVSDIQLFALGKNRDWVLHSMNEIVGYAQKRFQYVSLGAQDASRADLDFLTKYIKRAEELGVFRVRIADTVGCLNPFSTYELVSSVINNLESDDLQIEFHGHNDLGMATANSLSAIHAGADCVSVTVNGLGERAGNAALEETIMALKLSMGIDNNYNTQLFNELCHFVAEASNRKMFASKPIVGDMTHRHESGIHTNSMLRDSRSYELYSANEVGKKGSTFVFGTHSGSAAINNLLEKNNIYLNKTDSTLLLNKVKNMSAHKKRNLTDWEVVEMAKCVNKEFVTV
jgi:homocitrate synthase NifV